MKTNSTLCKEETISSLIEKTKKEIEKWILKHYENSSSRVCQVFDYKRELAEARLKALNECAEMIESLIFHKSRPDSYNEEIKIINVSDIREILGEERQDE